jgi:hypothetical protein
MFSSKRTLIFSLGKEVTGVGCCEVEDIRFAWGLRWKQADFKTSCLARAKPGVANNPDSTPGRVGPMMSP